MLISEADHMEFVSSFSNGPTVEAHSSNLAQSQPIILPQLDELSNIDPLSVAQSKTNIVQDIDVLQTGHQKAHF